VCSVPTCSSSSPSSSSTSPSASLSPAPNEFDKVEGRLGANALPPLLARWEGVGREVDGELELPEGVPEELAPEDAEGEEAAWAPKPEKAILYRVWVGFGSQRARNNNIPISGQTAS
jgi:hypothetical protein